MEWMFTLAVILLAFLGLQYLVVRIFRAVTDLVVRSAEAKRPTRQRMYRSRSRHLAKD
jgi:hypothetical protein